MFHTVKLLIQLANVSRLSSQPLAGRLSITSVFALGFVDKFSTLARPSGSKSGNQIEPHSKHPHSCVPPGAGFGGKQATKPLNSVILPVSTIRQQPVRFAHFFIMAMNRIFLPNDGHATSNTSR